MAERMTSATSPVAGIADTGRQTRPEMIRQYRAYYQSQLDEAQRALAVTDDEIIVETYLGVVVQKNKRVVA